MTEPAITTIFMTVVVALILIPILLGLPAVWYKLGKVEEGIIYLIRKWEAHLDEHERRERQDRDWTD